MLQYPAVGIKDGASVKPSTHTKHTMNATQAYAVPESDSIIDIINPATGRSAIQGESLPEIQLRYPGAQVVALDDWTRAKAEKQDEPVAWLDTTEERYWEMLEVLPPAIMVPLGFLVGEPWDHHAVSGLPRYQAFIERDGKFLQSSRPLTVPEFKAHTTHN